jgi:hypothetical protein
VGPQWVMARHHFVPQFLLRRWAKNGLLVCYSWVAGAERVIENPRVSVASACQVEDLNAFYGVPRASRNSPEDEFFTPQGDTPAASALETMLSGGVRSLTKDQRRAFARLLVSFGVRTPETLRDMGPKEFRKAMETATDRSGGPPALEAIVDLQIEAAMPAYERNVPLNIAMDLSGDPQKCAAVEGMEWWLRRFDNHSVLIGDRPLLANCDMPYPCGIPLNDPNCLIVLPVAPDTVFFASANPNTRAKMRLLPVGKLARAVNEETIVRAKEYVYAHDTSMRSFASEKIAARQETRTPSLLEDLTQT